RRGDIGLDRYLHPQSVAGVVGQARAVLEPAVDVIHVVGDRALELPLDRNHLAVWRQRGRWFRRWAVVPAGGFLDGLSVAMLFHARGRQGLVDRLDPKHVGVAGTHAAP